MFFSKIKFPNSRAFNNQSNVLQLVVLAFAKKEDRLNKDGMVWILDYDGNRKATIELNGIGRLMRLDV